MKVCLNKMPPRTELSDTHYTYCWLRQKEEDVYKRQCSVRG